MTSELRSVCWIEELWNGDEILLGKPEVESARLCECIAGIARPVIDVGIKRHRCCSVYLLLGLVTWCCLEQYCLFIALLATNTAQSRYFKIQTFRTAACRHYRLSNNFDCTKRFLRITITTSDCPVWFPHCPAVVQITVSWVWGCLSLTDVDCFMALNWCRLLYGTKLMSTALWH